MTEKQQRIEAAAEAIWRTFAEQLVRRRPRKWEQVPPVLQARYRQEAAAALDAANRVTM